MTRATQFTSKLEIQLQLETGLAGENKGHTEVSRKRVVHSRGLGHFQPRRLAGSARRLSAKEMLLALPITYHTDTQSWIKGKEGRLS